jgi:hypothetical protein
MGCDEERPCRKCKYRGIENQCVDRSQYIGAYSAAAVPSQRIMAQGYQTNIAQNYHIQQEEHLLMAQGYQTNMAQNYHIQQEEHLLMAQGYQTNMAQNYQIQQEEYLPNFQEYEQNFTAIEGGEAFIVHEENDDHGFSVMSDLDSNLSRVSIDSYETSIDPISYSRDIALDESFKNIPMTRSRMRDFQNSALHSRNNSSSSPAFVFNQSCNSNDHLHVIMDE